MLEVRLIGEPPRNFDRFVDEIGTGLGQLYGQAAETQYRATIDTQFAATLRHRAVRTFAAFVEGRVAALCVTHLRPDRVGRISLMHVLSAYLGTGIEERLLEEAVAALKRDGTECITSEYVSFSDLDLEERYSFLGFKRIPRRIMGTELGPLLLESSDAPLSEPMDPSHHVHAAGLLLDAYAKHVDHELHHEVRSKTGCLELIKGVSSGRYGAVRRDYQRVILKGENCVAVVLGSEVAPDVGFLLQLAVSPGARGHGLGARLIREEAGVFQQSGLERIALGVTDANPALRLYERLGFSVWKRIDAYVWRAE